MFSKTRVANGKDVDPLFVDLARRTGKSPQWNFHKYLISRDGNTVVSRASEVDPASAGFVAEVEKMLAMR
jgi:glutathione peroxidase